MNRFDDVDPRWWKLGAQIPDTGGTVLMKWGPVARKALEDKGIGSVFHRKGMPFSFVKVPTRSGGSTIIPTSVPGYFTNLLDDIAELESSIRSIQTDVSIYYKKAPDYLKPYVRNLFDIDLLEQVRLKEKECENQS